MTVRYVTWTENKLGDNIVYQYESFEPCYDPFQISLDNTFNRRNLRQNSYEMFSLSKSNKKLENLTLLAVNNLLLNKSHCTVTDSFEDLDLKILTKSILGTHELG
jgi:hypothetical protein